MVALEKELSPGRGSGFTSTTPAISTAGSATAANICIASVVDTLKIRICRTIPVIPAMSCIASKRKKRGNNGEQNGDDHVHDHRNKGKNAIIMSITERLSVMSIPLFRYLYINRLLAWTVGWSPLHRSSGLGLGLFYGELSYSSLS